MDTLSRPASNYTIHSNILPSNSTSGVSIDLNTSKTAKAIKLSKRVNARLQLAAALIEADNEEIERKCAAQRRQYDVASASLQAHLPKIASESVIFAPYRDQDAGEHHTRGGRRSSGLDSEGRPVIDFLGVKLPAEKRQAQSNSPDEGFVGGRLGAISPSIRQPRPFTHASRASSEWPSRPVSRTGSSNLSTSRPLSTASIPLSHGGLEGGHEEEEATLSEWGVEKFLSSEARQRIETGRRSRANSVIERPESALSTSSIGKAHSEIGTEASTQPVGDLTLSKLDLLARIKMYREGQQEAGNNLPDEAEQSLYASLKDNRMHGHLKALTQAEGSSVGTVSQAKNTIVGGRKSVDLGRTLSKSGITGDSWSEQGDETVDPTWTLSQAAQQLSEIGEETIGHSKSDEDDGQHRRSTPIEITRPLRLGSPIQEMEQHADGMAGIGSFSRSPRSRSHSTASMHLLSVPLAVQPDNNFTINDEEDEYSHPRSAFLSKSTDAYPTMESASPRRQSSPHLTTPSSTLPPRETSPRRVSMLNPAFSPRLRPSPDALLASIDPYFDMAGFNLSPYPTLGGPASRMMDAPEATGRQGVAQQASASTFSLSTRQLQELARQSSFPASFGLGSGYPVLAGLPDEDAELLNGEQEIFRAEIGEQEVDVTALLPGSKDISTEEEMPSDNHDEPQEAAPRPIEAFVGASQEPDLSSARWGRKKRKSILANKIMLRKATLETVVRGKTEKEDIDITHDDIDDDYTSPPMQGPLRPQGIECRLPSQLTMPQILAGTSLAPRRRLTDEQARIDGGTDQKNKPRVPTGFVLHNRNETVSMKTLTVHGASGNKPFFMDPKGKHKHDRLVSNFLQSHGAQRLIPVSASAPPGIGRRAAMNSTALFRNQLVQHEEEKEGWGWEAGSRIGTELVEVEEVEEREDKQQQNLIEVSGKKLSRKEKKLAKKMRAEKQKRKEARRMRRKKRELAKAKNMSLDELGLDEMSPDEDLDLSGTSSDEESSDETGSEASSVGQGEARWIDEERPAGRLYGKSLLDVVDERKKKVSSKARQYGQVRLEDLQGDDVSIVASTVGGAPSFRDNPVGFNDTRERMEAMFGPDQIWARETAKRQLEEAKEAEEATVRQLALAELEAEESAKKEAKKSKKGRKSVKKVQVEETVAPLASPMNAPEENTMEDEVSEFDHTTVEPPTINLELPQDSSLSHKPSSLSGAAAQWLESDGSGDESDDSDAQAEQRTRDLQRARMSRSLGGRGQNLLKGFEQDDSDEEEDNVPLSTLRSKLPPPIFSSQLGVTRAQYDSDEEELPLSQLVANRKKKTQSLGNLDLNFMIGEVSSSQRGDDVLISQPSNSEGDDDDDEDDAPIGLKLAPVMPIAHGSVLARNESNNEDSDDEPLGVSHPQAAIITEQANMIKQLQTELVFKQQQQQQQQMMAIPGPFGFPNHHMSMLPPSPYMAAAPYPMRPMSMMPMPQMGPPMMMQQQDASIAMWASQVDPNAEKSI